MLVSLCTLIPLVLLISFCIFGSFWVLITKQNIVLTCERHSLGAQEKLLRGTEELLALNPPVKALILEKKILEVAIKTAPNPAAKAAAKLMLELVRMQMAALRVAQKTLIVSSESLALIELFRFKTDIYKMAKTAKQSWQSSSLKFPQIAHSPPRLQIQELIYLGEKSLPMHQRTPNYEDRQRLDLRMQWDTKNFLPPWMGKISKQLGIWEETCGAQPKNQGGTWFAVLSKARPFSKF